MRCRFGLGTTDWAEFELLLLPDVGFTGEFDPAELGFAGDEEGVAGSLTSLETGETSASCCC